MSPAHIAAVCLAEVTAVVYNAVCVRVSVTALAVTCRDLTRSQTKQVLLVRNDV